MKENPYIPRMKSQLIKYASSPLPSFFFLHLLLAVGCNSEGTQPKAIFRSKADQRVKPVHAHPSNTGSNQTLNYPWDDNDLTLKSITKEYFRCKGSSLNPPHIIYENGKEKDRIWDCGGVERHGLPVRGDTRQEYIYPALLEILNFVQSTLQKPIVITSGHRCPSHEQYIDRTLKSTSSKHLIGAAVSFFVEGYENRPEAVVAEVIRYYSLNPIFTGKQPFVEFNRTQSSDTLTQAWSNKEILIKLYLPNEGRNLDNRHPFPYLDIQVRFDREKGQPVSFSWQDAQTYLRK